MLHTTYSNISVISWRYNLPVEEFGVPGLNRRHPARYLQTLSHSVVSSTPNHEHESNSRMGLIAYVNVNLTRMQSRPYVQPSPNLTSDLWDYGVKCHFQQSLDFWNNNFWYITSSFCSNFYQCSNKWGSHIMR
jgi:hypothetical protein